MIAPASSLQSSSIRLSSISFACSGDRLVSCKSRSRCSCRTWLSCSSLPEIGLLALQNARFRLVQILFLDRKRVQLAIQRVFALFQPAFQAFQFVSLLFDVALELLLALDLFLPGRQFDLLGLVLGLGDRVILDLARLPTGPCSGRWCP